MPTPPMLQPRSPLQAAPPATPARSDPLVAVNVAALCIIFAGLLLAGLLAMYSWETPGAEEPLVLVIAAVFVVTLLVDITVLTGRHLRRLRVGL